MKKITLLLPIIAGILWGSSGIFVRTLADFGMDGMTIFFSRAFIAVFMMLALILITDRTLLKIRIKDLWIFIVCGIVGMLGLNLCYNEAISRLTLSLAAVLLSLSPVFVMILAAIFFKEKITLKKVGCMCLAFAGCMLVSGLFEGGSSNQSLLGILLGFLSAVLYALYSIGSRVAMEKGYHTYTIIFYSLLLITIALLPFVDLDLIGKFAAVKPGENIVFLLVNALFTSVLPYVLYTLALQKEDAGKVSILAAGGEPTAAAFFGMIVYSEIPTPFNIIGLIVTIFAIYLLCRKDKNKV